MINRSLIRKFAFSISGSIIAQIISIALTPIITRIYTPADVGMLSSFNTVTSLIIPLSMGSLHIAVVLTKTYKQQFDLAKLSLIVAVLTSILVIVFGMVMNHYGFTGNTSLYIISLAIFVLVSSFVQLCEQFAIKREQFSLIASRSVLQSCSNNFLKILLSTFFMPSGFLLILSTLVGVGTVLLSYWTCLISIIRHKSGVNDFVSIVRLYKDFPLYQAPQGVINAFSHGVPVIFLTYYFSIECAGWYGLSRTVLGIPILLLGSSVSSVLYPRLLSVFERKEDFHREILIYTAALFILASIGFSIFVFFGVSIFNFVFGSDWRNAGEFSGLMVPLFILMLASRPIVPAISILSMQRKLLVNELISVLGKTIALYVGLYVFHSANSAIFLYSIVGAVVYMVIIAQVLSKAKKVQGKHDEICFR